MQEFKKNDKVYCPSLSDKPFLIFRKKDVNGIFIKCRGIDYWFTVNGIPSSNSKFPTPVSVPIVFLATEENRIRLSEIYSREFREDEVINLYALNVTFNGSATDDWVFPSQEGYFDYHAPNAKIEGCPTIAELQWYDILVTPHTEELKYIQERFLKSHLNTKIICVGKESINNWSNDYVSNNSSRTESR